MKIFNLGNGHTFKEDGKALFGCEYYSKDALELEYDITL